MATVEDIEEMLLELLRELVLFTPIIGEKREAVVIDKKRAERCYPILCCLIQQYLEEKQPYEPKFLGGGKEDQQRFEIIVKFLGLDEFQPISEALVQLEGHHCPN